MRLADRLAVARRRRVVGRAAELALFTSALADPEPPFTLLYVHGPGGVGKTVLLGEFDRLAAEAGCRRWGWTGATSTRRPRGS